MHRGTDKSKHEEQSILIFIPEAVGSAPFLRLFELKCTICSGLATVTLESGGGVGSNFGTKMELSEGEPRNANI